MKDYVFVIGGKALSAAAQMAMLVLLTIQLPPERLAVLLALYSLAVVIASLGDLGLGTLAMRERAYGERRKADQTIRLGDRLATFLAVIGVGGVALASIWSPELLACAPLLAWGPTERATESRMLTLLADGKSRTVAVVSGSRRIAALLLYMLLAQVIPEDLAFSISLAAASLVFLLLTVRLAPLGDSTVFVNARSLLSEAVPFTLTSVSGQMRNLDVPIVTFLVGGSAAAAYGLGARLASPIMLIFSSISGLILVRARKYSYRRLVILTVSLLVGSSLLVVTMLSVAVGFGSTLTSYVQWFDAAAVLSASLVASSYLFAGCGIIFGSLLVAFGMQRTLARLTVTTVCTALVLVTFFSLMISSAIYASVSTLSCYFVQSILLAIILLRSQNPRNRNIDRNENAPTYSSGGDLQTPRHASGPA